MVSFETLLHVSADELLAIFSATRAGPHDDDDVRREQLAQQLGVRVTQLLCAVGFNPATRGLDVVVHALGYSDFAALASARNFAFIDDVYRALSINNVLEIYAVIGRAGSREPNSTDLVASRINNIESQLEETINPILIGGYKLEIRGIYENGLASPEFVRSRLSPAHAVMRDIANENAIMLERGVIEPLAFLQCDGVSPEEKRRAVFRGLIPPAIADHYIRSLTSSEEQRLFREALTGAAS